MKMLHFNLLLLSTFLCKIAYSQEILEKEMLIFCPNDEITCCGTTLLIFPITENPPFNLYHFVEYERNKSLYQSYLDGIYYRPSICNIRYKDREKFTDREIYVIDSIEADIGVKVYFSDSLQDVLLAKNIPPSKIKTSRQLKKMNEGKPLSGYFFTCKFRYMCTGSVDVCMPNPHYKKYGKKNDYFEIHKMPMYLVLDILSIEYYIPKHKKIPWKRKFR